MMIACICFLFSCQEKWQVALEKIDKSLLYHNDYQGWKLVREIKNEWDNDYIIEKTDKDTLKILLFLEGKKDGSIRPYEYKKRYPCNGVDTCFLEMTSQDTLFYYREKEGLKIFEVGEYAYLFTHMKMDSIELDYYLKHEDSLRRVRGNNLPKLPNKK
jgi:hypothetical protein